MSSLFQLHKQKWESCTLCPLCEVRDKVVLARGSVPASIVLVGEAPGASENRLGSPFSGPAGHLLNHIISESVGNHTYALTNLVGCIPIGDDGDKIAEPNDESIKACAPRLIEFVRICKPRLIVLVGKLAKKHIYGQAQFSEYQNTKHPKFGTLPWLPDDKFLEFVEIAHPAHILRTDVSQKGLMIQRCVVALQDAIEKLR